MKIRLLAFACLVAIFAGACSSGRDVSRGLQSSTPDPVVTSGVDLTQSDLDAPDSSTAEVVKRVLPAVVNVRVTSINDGILGPSQSQGEGSGVIIDEGGTILTNNHVVAGAVKVTVKFNDDHEEMNGTVVGTDPDRDLAVINVDADDLTPITLGRSGRLELGDSVIALGFPLGLGGPTVTKGIVSGLDRTINVSNDNGESENLVGLLQTDAAINPGNSGGALVDSAGQLIGINTAAAQASSAENVGFAIAIDEALPVIGEILSEPAEERAWLGVQVVGIEDSAAAAQVDLPSDARGSYVISVFDGSAAKEAGIQEGDLLVAIDTKPIEAAEDLTTVLTGYDPGDEVEVIVFRDGREISISVELGQRPATIE
ncbi:MAG TPA: trypsin-like peptidase domain-containing protein [Actinomycetota bacterium]|jgi:S1-C subfamily serine protease